MSGSVLCPSTLRASFNHQVILIDCATFVVNFIIGGDPVWEPSIVKRGGKGFHGIEKAKTEKSKGKRGKTRQKGGPSHRFFPPPLSPPSTAQECPGKPSLLSTQRACPEILLLLLPFRVPLDQTRDKHDSEARGTTNYNPGREEGWFAFRFGKKDGKGSG